MTEQKAQSQLSSEVCAM